jgi:hypothetical protein
MNRRLAEATTPVPGVDLRPIDDGDNLRDDTQNGHEGRCKREKDQDHKSACTR